MDNLEISKPAFILIPPHTPRSRFLVIIFIPNPINSIKKLSPSLKYKYNNIKNKNSNSNRQILKQIRVLVGVYEFKEVVLGLGIVGEIQNVDVVGFYL